MSTYTYTTIDDPLGSSTIAYGINASGQIVGTYNPSGAANGFFYDGGTYTTLAEPNAYGINDGGQIVGNYTILGPDSALATHGYFYSGGTYTTLDDPSASGGITSTTSANGINNDGQIVGYYRDSGGNTHGFLDSGGTYTTLDDPLATNGNTFASGINTTGQIVGYYSDSASVNHGFLYSGGIYTTLDDPLATGGSTYATGINDTGQIAGYYTDSAGLSHGFDATAPGDPQSTLPVSIGGTATISTGFLSSYDPDNPAAELTYTVETAPTHGTILLNGVAATSFTQTDIDDGLVQYRENGDVATSDGFTFQLSDPTGNHITEDFTIAILNTTAPVIDANNTLPGSIGRSTMIWTDALCTVALGNEPTDLKYAVVTGPAHGVLLVNDAPASSFTQAEIDDHRVRYQNTGDAATRDSFTFQATDAAGDQTLGSTFNIAISGSPTVPLFDLSDISFGPNTNLSYSANSGNTGGALTVSDGMHTADLALLGQYAASGFATAPDQGGGTVITYTAAPGSSGDPNLLTIPQH